jgi:hypothetical protein
MPGLISHFSNGYRMPFCQTLNQEALKPSRLCGVLTTPFQQRNHFINLYVGHNLILQILLTNIV